MKEELKEKIRSFLHSEDANKFEHILKQSPILTSIRVRGIDPKNPGWYDLMIDTSLSENPKLSLLRLIIRLSDYSEYLEIPSRIEEIVAVVG